MIFRDSNNHEMQSRQRGGGYRANSLLTNNNWSTSAATNDYLTQISYDKNGNILTLDRNGYGSNLDMDQFTYNYYTLSGDKSNRLNYVTDAVTTSVYADDIKNGQATGNYTYNKIGELIEDVQEDMTLQWRFGDHKLSKIYRGTNSTTPQLEFVYNPLGVRVAKIKRTQNDGTVLPLNEQTVTYYAYDANGLSRCIFSKLLKNEEGCRKITIGRQVMAVYESLLYHEDGETTLAKQYIYGSSRVGVIKQNKTVYFDGLQLEFASDYRSNTLGNKRYELTNHLGNVLSTISDRKIWNSTDSHYEAVVTMYADYYAFGMMMPNRFDATAVADTRHLFNGMEHDGELSGSGNSYTTEFRQYDPRLGRWKSLDPLMSMFPSMSPYVGFANNPIYYTDPYGLAPTNDGGGDDKKKVKGHEKSDGSFDGHQELEEVVISGVSKKKDENNFVGNLENHIKSVENTTNSIPDTRTNSGESPHNQVPDWVFDMVKEIPTTEFSLGLLAIDALGGLSEAERLLKSGKFEVIYKGETKTWSLKFSGNKHVDVEFVKSAKAKAMDVSANKTSALKVVKGTGIILNVVGLAVSINEAYTEYSTDGSVSLETGADVVFGIVGFLGPVGTAASASYFLVKQIHKSAIESGATLDHYGVVSYEEMWEVFKNGW